MDLTFCSEDVCILLTPDTKQIPASAPTNYAFFHTLISSLSKNEPKFIVDLQMPMSVVVHVPSSLITFVLPCLKLGGGTQSLIGYPIALPLSYRPERLSIILRSSFLSFLSCHSPFLSAFQFISFFQQTISLHTQQKTHFLHTHTKIPFPPSCPQSQENIPVSQQGRHFFARFPASSLIYTQSSRVHQETPLLFLQPAHHSRSSIIKCFEKNNLGLKR